MSGADIAVIPRGAENLPQSYCLMFYEYERRLDSSWLDTVEELFCNFGQIPARAIGHLEEKTSIGQYKRVKARLGKFLDAHYESDGPNFNVDSEHCFPEDKAFPCQMRISWTAGTNTRMPQGVIAVRAENVVMSLSKMVDSVGELLFAKIGRAYAHAFKFPAVHGPDCYLVSLGF